MSEAVVVALIMALPLAIGQIANIIISLRNGTKLTSATEDLAEVKKHTNGMVDKIEATAKAVGVTQGHAEAAANSAANPKA